MRTVAVCVLLVLLVVGCRDGGQGADGPESDKLAGAATTSGADVTPAASSSAPSSAAETKRVRSSVQRVVHAFGQQLKQVSLLAAPDEVRRQMQAHYAVLVAPELLQDWLDDPASAPGRKVSSPWPDAIEITNLTPITPHKYAIVGKVVYADSSGTARTEPVQIEVQREPGGTWHISGYHAATSDPATDLDQE